MESSRVAGARLPPARARVNHGRAARLRLIRTAEIRDPADHLRGAEAPALAAAAAGAALHVDHAGQGDAVVGPAAAVRQEVGGLGRAAAGRRVSKVVAAADEARRRGRRVVLAEG